MTSSQETAAVEPFMVGFLDDDHVIRLASALLNLTDAAARDYVTGFFLPERFDHAEALRMAAGLTPNDDVTANGPRLPGTPLIGCDAIVFRRGRIDAGLFDANPDLRLVQRLGANPEGIDMGEAARRGIAISCLPRPTLAMVAEHVLMMMLAVTRRLFPADRGVRDGLLAAGKPGAISYNWLGLTGIGTLWGRTLGIIGMGEIGILLAERARAFGMTVLYSDVRRLPPQLEARLGAKFAQKNELLTESDFVSLHVPNTPENSRTIDVPDLRLMRRDAVLINTSRGAVVNEEALLAALSNGSLGGAGLDVHACEPRQVDRLSGFDNVVLTPHMAGGSRLGVLNEIGQMFDNLRAVRHRKTPPHGVLLQTG